MPPSFQPASLNLTGTISITIEEPGAAPSTIIQGVDTPFQVRVDWSISGTAVQLIDGKFLVRALIEGYGVGATEVDLGPVIVPVQEGALVGLTRTYLTRVPVPEGLPEGAYTIVAVITYVTPVNTPGPIAAMSEPTIIQIFP